MTRLVVLLLVGVVGCQNTTEAPRAAKTSTAAQREEVEAKPTLKEQREAFGVALPPDGYDINRSEFAIEATTKLNLSRSSLLRR
ncbi:MAG: hypothetical protein R3E66_07535 [bacterium]